MCSPLRVSGLHHLPIPDSDEMLPVGREGQATAHANVERLQCRERASMQNVDDVVNSNGQSHPIERVANLPNGSSRCRHCSLARIVVLPSSAKLTLLNLATGKTCYPIERDQEKDLSITFKT